MAPSSVSEVDSGSSKELHPTSSFTSTELDCKPALWRRAARSIRAAWLKFSDWCIEWTPFMLVACYWPTVTAIFVMCSSQAIQVLYYFYMVVNLYIAAVSAFESFLALTPVREARAAAIKFNKTEINLRKDAGNDLPFMDMVSTVLFEAIETSAHNTVQVMVAYLPNEKDIVEQQLMHALEELQYPSHK